MTSNTRRGEGHYSHNHLLAAQEGVEDELASSQRDGGVVVSHLVGLVSTGRREWLMERFVQMWWLRGGRQGKWRLEREGKISGASGL